MKNKKLTGYLFIAPWIIGFLVFTAYPFISSLWLSFTNYNLLSAPKFIGLDNYVKLFKDPLFIKTLMNTLKYVFITVPTIPFVLFATMSPFFMSIPPILPSFAIPAGIRILHKIGSHNR